MSAQTTLLDGVAAPPKRGTAPSFWFMSQTGQSHCGTLSLVFKFDKYWAA